MQILDFSRIFPAGSGSSTTVTVTTPIKDDQAVARDKTGCDVDMSSADSLNGACAAISRVYESGGGLLVLTGAGMSVSSGVPVFRAADGTMSPDFLRFLNDFNAARRKALLTEADDWFNFSVPEMFRAETAKEAWAYWRWRTLRARVEPGNDYRQLSRLVELFGPERMFVVTSNCDGLHESAGVSQDALFECHGSLARLQCSEPCSNEMWPADDAFLKQLRENPEHVPMCPKCKSACLRPNVMIFGDGQLVQDVLAQQDARRVKFCEKFSIEDTPNDVVLTRPHDTETSQLPPVSEVAEQKEAGTSTPSAPTPGAGVVVEGVAKEKKDTRVNHRGHVDSQDALSSLKDSHLRAAATLEKAQLTQKSVQVVMAQLDERLETASAAINRATAQVVSALGGGGGGGGEAGAGAAADAAAATRKTNTSNNKKSRQLNCVVLEVGAGTVVSSIRCRAEALGAQGHGLVRVNPSQVECENMQSFSGEKLKKDSRSSSSSSSSGGIGAGGGGQDTRYWPFAMRSEEALRALCNELKLPPAPSSAPSSAAAIPARPAPTSLQFSKLKVPKLTDFGNGASAAQSGT